MISVPTSEPDRDHGVGDPSVEDDEVRDALPPDEDEEENVTEDVDPEASLD